ncbi:hypothetical protein WA026_022630, partial [Henosepilachna vigintioctopunctata]
ENVLENYHSQEGSRAGNAACDVAEVGHGCSSAVFGAYIMRVMTASANNRGSASFANICSSKLIYDGQ